MPLSRRRYAVRECSMHSLLTILPQRPKDVENGKDKKEEDDKAVKRTSEDKDDRDSKRRYVYQYVCLF
jgi:hypothetical protein